MNEINIYRSHGITYRIVCNTQWTSEIEHLMKKNGLTLFRVESDLFSNEITYWVIYVDPDTLSQLNELVDHDSYDSVQYKYNNGLISAPVYESYCHLWRNSNFHFSHLLEGYENFDDLLKDTQELITKFLALTNERKVVS